MIADTNIPLPFNCSEWTIDSKFNLSDITPELLEKPVRVRVGRDDHLSSIIEYVSPFTAFYNINTIQHIIAICGIEYLYEYVEPRANGNILHAVILNPNIEIARLMIELLPLDVVRELANKPNRHGRLPIELIDRDLELFELLFTVSPLSRDHLEDMAKYSGLVREFINKNINH